MTDWTKAIREALAQPEQETNNNGSPCPEFWDWLPKAYNFEGNGNFTKYNMEVAFLAGKQASQPEQEPVAYVKTVIEALYENSDPVSVEAAELLERITTPPQRKPLTDEEVEKIIKANMSLQMNLAGIRQDFEAAHGIKGEA